MKNDVLIRHFICAITIIFLFSSCSDREHKKQQFLLKGNEAFSNQNYTSAIRYFEEALKLDSCYAPALNNLATLHYKQERLDKALHLYEKAVSCEPEFYQASINLANTLYDLKQYYRSIDVLNRQLKNTPDSSKIHFVMGLNLTRLRDYDSARATFIKALSYESENPEILINLGTLEYYLENFDQSKEYLNTALRIDENQPEAYNTLSLVLTAEKNYIAALENINKAISLREEAHFLNNKGFILIKLNELEQAEALINESILMNPMNAWAFRNKAIIMLEKKRGDEALRLLRQAQKIDDWVEDVYFYTGQAYQQLGKNDAACDQFQKGAGLNERKSKDALLKECQK